MALKKLLAGVLLLYVVLGSWKGYVALFQENAEEPSQIYPCKIAALPEQDQIALAEGILVRNQRELNRLLEDLLS